MDWARDDAYLSCDASLGTMFKFEPKPTMVIKIVETNQYQSQVWILEGYDQWARWVDDCVSYTERGLVLILAKRAGGQTIQSKGFETLTIAEWLSYAGTETFSTLEVRRAQVLASLAEKTSDTVRPSAQRGIRTLPFSRETFKLLSERLRIHESIKRAISRSKVPLFSAERLEMTDGLNRTQTAYVYSCRTPNAWDMDLALSETYYPHCGLNLSVLYGCDVSTEIQVLRRLQSVSEEAAHPLIVPGILAEVELSRHKHLVESNIIAVEGKIFELSLESADPREQHTGETQERNADKRSAWLDLTYLRNSLISWKVQLSKMADHVDELDVNAWRSSHFHHRLCVKANPTRDPLDRDCSDKSPACEKEIGSNNHQDFPMESSENLPIDTKSLHDSPIEEHYEGTKKEYPNVTFCSANVEVSQLPCTIRTSKSLAIDHDHQSYMRNVGYKIERRLSALRDEYEGKIRDCTMRLDGMAMATQWSHSETNVEIALATNRDSRVMRSISLVTMIFLPGTFFATVFSMTFFNWSSASNGTMVSKYLWIYVVITVAFTSLTLAMWYFLVIHRRRNRIQKEYAGGMSE